VCAATGTVYLAQALPLARLITAFQLPVDQIPDRVNFYAGMLFLVAGVSMLTYAVMGWVTNLVSQTLTRRYRFELLQSMLRQSTDYFDSLENAAAALTSHLSTAPTGLQELLGVDIVFVLVVIVTLISCVTLALATGWKLGLVISSTLPLIFGTGVARLRLEIEFDEQNAAVFAECAQFSSQAVGVMQTVVAFTIEHAIWAEYDARLAALLRKSYTRVAMSMACYALAESVQYLVMALAFWYGGQLVARSEYRTEQFYVIYLAILFGGEAAAQFFGYTPGKRYAKLWLSHSFLADHRTSSSDISKAVKGGNYILKLRHSHVAIADEPDGKAPCTAASFTFDRVSFEYPLRKGVPVLQGLDLVVSRPH
jgi:ATP-binding cassette, subfamily B (MDR/TAP), member 1